MNEDKLRQFAALVEKWSPKINLVSKADLPHLWERHVQDSLRLVPYIPAGTARAIDLGSGAGFPGMVLAIATGIPFDLVEADTRKAAFLREAARITGAPAKIHNTRIEATNLIPAPLITARALAPLDKLLGLAAPLLAPDGVCLFPKGRGWEAELTAAKALWHMQAERIAAPGWGDSCILKVSQIRHAAQA
ncbi:16S rRNA (guanine(527)-N(7))-methyltransferase RsmG [Acidocella sp. KAb 2-4]|uniref:16S rRNA (guanine(527)-N(7))-methyltransferase RsmG n=1 Tax=Acidocella sp. KAb 2-4 TaxID=2885158 RepID=UPI001D070383|nr:16S rRNA (guanine(527)-N(7))-methyltransferase RsmG [Acidocella sp. KAb 2-4]MCB5944177.1 16S rRNA (guanine(527)-N(7))-methyltransferase RsmG [Acidocella sp. KAb 2-4]